MGRRKIEIKAIKDDRNRSVTFLKRKGGLFKKAHELSVLCSVDVAVFVFGNNKKVYEYSSTDMRELIARYQIHGGANEHKGPGDFSGGAGDDDDEDDIDASPPQGPDSLEPHLMPPHHYHGQQPHFPQIRHQTPTASPPIPNGSFQGHPQSHQRGHTPQPSIGSRPGSRNDVRRMGPGMGPGMMPPGAAHPGVQYIPTPPMYNHPHPVHPHHSQPNMISQPGPPYQYPSQAQQQPQQPQSQQHPFIEERRTSAPPSHGFQPPPMVSRAEPSPQPPHQSIPQISKTPPKPEHREPKPPPPVVPKVEAVDRLSLNTEHAIKKLPQRKGHSIFTPIEENRSILSQHLASFASDSPLKPEPSILTGSSTTSNVAATGVTATRPVSPPCKDGMDKPRTASTSSVPESSFTPPSRASSLASNLASNPAKSTGPAVGGARPRGPRLTVQIPDGGSEPNSAVETSTSPKPGETAVQPPQRPNSHPSVVLPPPSPSATTLLSAGATGPPNPFARPPPQQSVNAETPASALPSRFLGQEFLPSPSSFYNDWNMRASGDNTLPSPLNFATPLGANGPSFLREEATAPKRKSPEFGDGEVAEGSKRVKVD